MNNASSNEFSRRAFLGTSGAAIAAGAIAAGGAVSAAQEGASAKKRNIKKAVMYNMLPREGSVTEKFAAIKEAGFDGVELLSPGGFKVEDVRAATKETGIAVNGVVDSIHWRTTLSDPSPNNRAVAVEALKTAIRECKAYGGTSVLLVPAVVNKQVSYADAWKRSIEEIRKAIPVAEENGVRIAIENVWNMFLLSPLEAARYVDEFNSPWVGWHFDIGNVVNYGWPEHWIAALDKRILKLHVKEYSRKLRDKEGPYAGFKAELMEGDNDWPAVMKALDAIGYEGWMTLEVGGGDMNRLKFLSDRLDKIIAA